MFTRRNAALALGMGASAGTMLAHASARPSKDGAMHIADLQARLSRRPPRRDFTSVPLMLENPGEWDDAAIRDVAAYRGGPKQVWDVKEIGDGWQGFVRNALNGQVYSFDQADFLTVSVHRGKAVLALIDQPTWDKYHLAKLAGPKFTANSFIAAADGPGPRKPFAGAQDTFSVQDASIPTLMKRGVVFMACHNAIFAMAGLALANANPGGLSVEQAAAEFTNHLLPGVILTPGALATLPLLQQAGFHYVT